MFLCCWQKTFGSVLKNEFYVLGAMFWSKLQFSKEILLFYHFGFQAKNFVFCFSSFQLFGQWAENSIFSAKICQQLYQNCILPVQTKPPKKNLFCGKSKTFVIFEFWARIFLLIEGRDYNCIVDTAFYMSTERVEEICYFKHVFIFFRNYRDLIKKKSDF